MISTSDFKRGVSIELDGQLYRLEEVQHVKTKKSAVYRVKLRDLRGGHIIERTFNAGDKVTAARVERRDMQYLYGLDGLHTFMNNESFEQISINEDVIRDAVPYLKEGSTVQVITHGDEALGVELPAAIEMKVVTSDPGIKGDTQSGANKPATLETGLVVSVPLFINPGDTIKVNTSSGSYIERTSTG